MQYNYLGGGQESGRSSVGQALGQTYSPLENMQKMSQEFAQQGLNNAGQMRRQMVSTGGQMAENQMARSEQRRVASEEQRAKRRQQLAYLGELINEQEMLADAAMDSNDPEQIRRVPEVLRNVARMKGMLQQGVNYDTLEGILKRNTETESLEANTAGNRGALRAPEQKEKPQQKHAGTQAKPEQKKEEGTRKVASARKQISID
jgi:hypothetical protein